MNNTVIQLITGGLVALIASVLTYLGSRPKNKAETEQIAVNVYKGLNADLLTQFKDVQKENNDMRTQVRELNTRLETMEQKDEEKDIELRKKNVIIEQQSIEIESLKTRVGLLEKDLKQAKDVYHTIEQKIGPDTIAAILRPVEDASKTL